MVLPDSKIINLASLVSWWSLNGTAGAISSGASVPALIGPTLTASNTSASYVQGTAGNGISFAAVNNNSTNMSTSSGNTLTGTSFSISWWFYWNGNNAGSLFFAIGNESNNGFMVSQSSSAGSPGSSGHSLNIIIPGLTYSAIVLGGGTNVSLVAGWGLYVITRNLISLQNGTWTAYINGAAITSGNYNGYVAPNSTYPMQIGGSWGANGTSVPYGPQGTIQDVRCYNRVLTAKEISYMYFSKKGVNQ